MIAKITRGADFAALTSYLIENRDHAVVDLRGVSGLDCAADEMARVAETSERTRTVVFHASVSVAIEDGVRDNVFWRMIGDELDGEIGFSGHQRVIIRHRDKAYDHIHVFWCAVNPETGRTPPKRWFRRKGAAALPEIGPCALTDAEVRIVPADQRVRKSYDSFALKRLQHLCRRLEREHGLRRLRSDHERGAARQRGELRARRRTQERRAERAGSVPLPERADALRDALDRPDWNARADALGRIGVGLKLVVRPGKEGARIRGLVLFDVADPGNTLPASDLDLAERRYGLRQIEKRQASHELTIEYWWPQPDLAQPHTSRSRVRSEPMTLAADADRHAEYRAYGKHEQERRQRLRVEKGRLHERHADEIERLREALQELRSKYLVGVDVAGQGQFRRWYRETVVEPALKRMRRIHRAAIRALRLERVLTFAQFRQAATVAEIAEVAPHNRRDVAAGEPARKPIAEMQPVLAPSEEAMPSDLLARWPDRDKGFGR